MTDARVLLLPEAADDVRRLDGSARRLVLKALKKLEVSPQQRGAPLGSKSNAQSDLTGFRKLVVGDRTYRVVYEVRADGTVVVVWVIGKRADAEVYREAQARIAAYTGDPARQALLRALLDAAQG
ncbi:type II toxin-antitoxin system RelE family toxin [Microbacterium sp.]|uniref:type II toxin-antitoxin system RelE family toxin n=1 Tax=Microbacterium sp. TaxID=51671 RepID=UPI003C76B9F7